MKQRTMDVHPELSIVVPFYNEAENVLPLWDIIHRTLQKLKKSYEVIFIDDGSTDGTRDIIKKLARSNRMLKAIIFRANFGQSAAMAAGFQATRGKTVIAMDGDLQNDPRDIPMLLAKLDEGYDIVSGWRANRQDQLIARKLPSKIANRLVCSLTDVKLHDTGCSLKAFRGDVLRRISLYGELHRFIPALMRIEGARIAEIPVNHHARKYGQSKYNLSRTFRVIMDLITIRLLMKHLQNPLSFFSGFAFFFFMAGAFLCSYSAYKLFWQQALLSDLNILLILTVLLWASAAQFLFFGLVGKIIVSSGSRRAVYAARQNHLNDED
jgi:glycosyltransferase involved in cell wall biosynthesis